MRIGNGTSHSAVPYKGGYWGGAMGTSPPTRIFDGFAFAALRRFAAGGARRADDIRPYGGKGLLVARHAARSA